MAKKIDWKYLMEKFASGTCTREEFDRLLSMIETDEDADGLTEEMRRQWAARTANEQISPEWKERFSNLLHESSGQRQKGKIRKMIWRKWMIAAAIIIISTAGFIGWQWSNNSVKNIAEVKIKKQSIAAGRNRALLILADGTSISLDSANNGTLATQGGVKIIKGEEGEILYYPDRQRSVATGYNTIITPRGGKYSIVLSDGTKVLLNAASSIQFPAEFTSATRDVSLNGEAYFEVAKNVSKPFHVSVNDIEVKVLGTEFNINAYSEEGHISTTLVNGAVKVAKTNTDAKGVVLKPGEQANLEKGNKKIIVDHSPDMNEVLAWKNGNFEFVNTPVPSILREISRWYDMDVIFKGALTEKRLTGTFSRNVNIDQLVAMLKYAGVNIDIENKKLLILPN